MPHLSYDRLKVPTRQDPYLLPPGTITYSTVHIKALTMVEKKPEIRTASQGHT